MRLGLATLALGALLLGAAPTFAGSSTIGFAVTSERMPHDLDASKSTDFELNGSHTFDNHWLVTGSVKYYDTSHVNASALNVEGAVGYTHAFNDVFSLTGTGGIGSHAPDPGRSFAYYFFKLNADIKLTDIVTWNAVGLRYRDSFDAADRYDTPEVSTGVTFNVTEQHSVSLRVMRDWRQGATAYDAIELGYKYHF